MIKGKERLMERINRLVESGKQLDKAILQAAGIVANEAKRRAPVDTGRLRNSIFFKKAGGRSAVVGTNVDYAVYVELGHNPVILPVSKKALRFYVRGAGWVFAKRVVQGQSGKSARWIKAGGKIKFPFLVPALQASKDKIVDLIRKVIKL